MNIIILVFLVLFSVVLLNLSDSVFVYSEENVANNIVIRDPDLIVEEYVSGLKFPVMIDFLHNDMLVIEKDKGTVRIIKDGILSPEPILQLDVSTTIEEGLVGILVKNDDVFLHYTTKNTEDNTTSNWFTKYNWDGTKLYDPIELLSFHNGNGMHNSGIMIEDENGIVFGGIGDTGNENGLFQNNPTGINDYTGSILSLETPLEVFAIGIRNTYGLDFDPVTGILWDTENGPDYFDEVNLVEKKFNSGWNLIQGPVTSEQQIPTINEFQYSDPEFSWERPAGLTAIHFINSKLFSNYHESVLVGSFHDGILYKFELNEKRDGFKFNNDELKDLVLNKDDNPNEIIFGTGFAGITDIKEGPDGSIYIVTIGDGKILRISPILDSQSTEANCADFSDSSNLSECNFSARDFNDEDFSNKDLKFVDFSDSVLNNIDFHGSNLVGANFENAILSNIDFSVSNLDSTIFKNGSLENVNFSDASLISVDFQYASFKELNFENSNLERGIFNDVKVHDVRLSGASLIKSELINSDFTGADFANSDLTFANFENALLEDTNFNHARLWKTKLNNVNLMNASFIESDNYFSEFKKSNLKYVDFHSSRLSNVNFDEANLSNSNLLDIYPIESSFNNSKLENSQINTCLKHDLGSRIINKILRTIDLEFIENILVNICN